MGKCRKASKRRRNPECPHCEQYVRRGLEQHLKRCFVANCACQRLSIGGALNWNPECPKHGTASDWWNSETQRAAREASRARLLELYRKARLARQGRRVGGS